RARLRELRAPPTRPAILARPLQPRQAAQLTARPTPDQPHSQRPWAGQLASHGDDDLRARVTVAEPAHRVAGLREREALLDHRPYRARFDQVAQRRQIRAVRLRDE